MPQAQHTHIHSSLQISNYLQTLSLSHCMRVFVYVWWSSFTDAAQLSADILQPSVRSFTQMKTLRRIKKYKTRSKWSSTVHLQPLYSSFRIYRERKVPPTLWTKAARAGLVPGHIWEFKKYIWNANSTVWKSLKNNQRAETEGRGGERPPISGLLRNPSACPQTGSNPL